jgi:hypothetical protein
MQHDYTPLPGRVEVYDDKGIIVTLPTIRDRETALALARPAARRKGWKVRYIAN